MGIVTDYLRRLIADQVKHHGLVAWFDGDRAYVDFVAALALPGVTIARYDGSYFKLRHDIDALLDGEESPPLLVYVPLALDDTHDALAEVTAVAQILTPSAATTIQNTRLSVVARRALEPSLGLEQAKDLGKQVDAGKLGLADLDALNDQQGGSPTLAALFGTGAPRDVAYAFLTSPAGDDKIDKRNAGGDLAEVLNRSLGTTLAPDATPADMRQQLARHILTVEFMSSLRGAPPQALGAVRVPSDPAQRDLAARLAHDWRNDWTQAESYTRAADETEGALRLRGMDLPLETIRECQTFAAVERRVQHIVQLALKDWPDPGLIALAGERQRGFWARQRADIGSGWLLTHTAGQVLACAGQIERALKKAPAQTRPLLRAYAEGDAPWCLLDTHHRHMEREWHRHEPGDDEALDGSLDALVGHARERYMQVGGALAESFTSALARERFGVEGVMRQRDAFARVVKPSIDAGKTAYVLVDALRFEMARELAESLQRPDSGFQPTLVPAIGAVPGITAVGMAALMPEAESDDVTLERMANGKLALRVGGVLLKDRDARVTWFKERASRWAAPVAIAKLEDVLPKPRPALEKELKAARLILITSQEIDELGESDNIALARGTMDAILEKLARLAHRLRAYGCQRIVFAADHGYLFGDALEDAMKLDPPGGETIDLHRRIWVGLGGASSAHVVRGRLSQLGLKSEWEFAAPVGFGAFKVQGGARAYFHGGLSPQELVVPVLSVEVGALGTEAQASFSLTPGTKKLSSTIYVVRVSGVSNGIFPRGTQRVRLELRSNKEAISEAFDAAYGLNRVTQEIEMTLSAGDRAVFDDNQVVLRVMRAPKAKTVTLVLTDAETGVELASQSVDVAMLDL